MSRRWQFAFSSNAFKRFTAIQAVEAIGRAGYQGVEVLADTPHWDLRTWDEKAVGGYRTALDRAHLTVSNINAFTLFAQGDTYHPSWVEDDPGKRRARVEHTKAAIRLARELGAPCLSTEPGGLLADISDREAALARFREGIKEVLPVAEQARVKLLIEPEPLCVLERPGECAAFLKSLPASPWLGMNCDLGHFYCMGESPEQVIREYHKVFSHVHLEDIASTRVHEHLLPGKGAMDFPGIFEALDEVDYEGFVTIELYPYQDAPEEAARSALAFCQSHLEEF